MVISIKFKHSNLIEIFDIDIYIYIYVYIVYTFRKRNTVISRLCGFEKRRFLCEKRRFLCLKKTFSL